MLRMKGRAEGAPVSDFAPIGGVDVRAMVPVLRRGGKCGLFDISSGSDKRSHTITADAVLDMCSNCCSQWFRPGEDMTIGEIQLGLVDLPLRMVGCATDHRNKGRPHPRTLAHRAFIWACCAAVSWTTFFGLQFQMDFVGAVSFLS